MTCQHLVELERALVASGITETYRGRPWTGGCREWVYFDCILDLEALRKRFTLEDTVRDHDHVGTHDGSELGFYCSTCLDGVMGRHPTSGNARVFR